MQAFTLAPDVQTHLVGSTIRNLRAERADSDCPVVAGYDFRHAHAEGWDVFDCGLREDGSPRIELQRLDNPACGTPLFSGDDAAWQHVVDRARQGSELHIAALRMVDPVERMSIEAKCGWCLGL